MIRSIRKIRCPSAPPFHHRNFLRRQSVQFVHQPVNRPVGRFDLALIQVLLGLRLGRRLVLVQGQHGLDQLHHLVVPRFVGGVREVDGADGKLR